MSKLVNEKVFNTIVRMAVPMLAGTFAMNAYQLTSTWFVSRLGTDALAAISFTFPVAIMLMLITRGIGMGSMTLTAHALGAKDMKKAAALTTHALYLAAAVGLAFTIAGVLTVKPVFSMLGASGEVLDLTAGYMRIWYFGCLVMVLQMVAGDAIVATGNTKAVSALMVGGTVINGFLDYGLIFGNFGMPKMGIQGAAVATILVQSILLIAELFMLGNKMGLIDLSVKDVKEIPASWLKILKFGIPGALGMALTPIASGIITKLLSGYGNAAVAASGVAARIEMFAFMIPMTVGMSLIPFVAQNFGAGRLDRILEARKGTMTFAFLYGIFIAVMFAAFAGPMAGLFSGEQAVINILKSYIYITCAGYGMLEVHRYAGFCMTGSHEPLKASLLDIIRIGFLLIPLSLLGSVLFGLNGIFIGRLVTDLAAGAIGIWWSGKVLKKKFPVNGRI